MLRIAICDDDASYVEQMLDYIDEYNKYNTKQIEIMEFYSGNSLLNHIISGNRFDIIYLDIEMDRLDGIRTAMSIREYDINVLLIYVSSHESYYQQLFEVEPFRFIKKPINKDQFMDILNKAISRLDKKSEDFHFKYNKSIVKLPFKDIVYFDSELRIVNIHTIKGKYSYYNKLDNVEKDILNKTNIFIRVHKSYLVNYDYIKTWEYTKVILYNGYEIQISEDRRSMIRKKYIELIGGINSGT